MTAQNSLILIDTDMRRRAAISHMLGAVGIHVEPFETPAEIGKRWPRTDMVLIEDTESAIVDLAELMMEGSHWLPVVGFAARPSTHRVARTIMDGAVDYLEWPFTAEEVREVMKSAVDNASGIGTIKLREAQARSRVQKLTQREREVLAGVADGLSNRRIGEKLAISPRTVEIHRANMLTKMGANHTSEAIRIAVEAALDRWVSSSRHFNAAGV